MDPITLKFDVSASLPREVTGGEPLHIAAWLFLPARLAPGEKPNVVALLNGGSYDKRYFHVQVPGRDRYSMADYLAERGHIVVLLDHLGISDSDKAKDQSLATRQMVARANHAALEQLYARLRAGTLHPSLPPVPDFVKVGGGHSMGGMQTITQQAEHGTYDLVMVLGYTAIGVHLTIGGQVVPAARPFDDQAPDYWLLDHASIAESFHWPDVPREVLAVDEALAVDVPHMISWQSISAGIVTEDAARIEQPVFIGLGERDVSPDPYGEPARYTASKDVTLYILPKAGHCHSFANTRLELYERAHRWITSFAH